MLALLAAPACNATVDPIGGGPGGSGSTSTAGVVASQGGNGQGGDGGFGTAVGGGSPTAAGGAGPTSIALFESELPGGEGGFGSTVVAGTGVDGSPETTSGGVGAGGAPPSNERLLLVIGGEPVSCGDPFAGTDCGASGSIAYIWLPPGSQEAGAHRLLSELDATYSVWGASGGECEVGTGGTLDGTIDVLAVDGASLRVSLSAPPAPSLTGEHTVSRCNPVASDESSAIAYFPSELPGDGAGGGKSAAVTSSGGGGQEDYVLDFADHATTCADPRPSPGPGQTFERFRVSLPFELVTAVDATYALSDARISCLHSELSENTGSTGSGGDHPGTITITGFNDAHVSVLVSGTGYDFVDGETIIPRCGG